VLAQVLTICERCPAAFCAPAWQWITAASRMLLDVRAGKVLKKDADTFALQGPGMLILESRRGWEQAMLVVARFRALQYLGQIEIDLSAA
jgi:hypothetical protein